MAGQEARPGLQETKAHLQLKLLELSGLARRRAELAKPDGAKPLPAINFRLQPVLEKVLPADRGQAREGAEAGRRGEEEPLAPRPRASAALAQRHAQRPLHAVLDLDPEQPGGREGEGEAQGQAQELRAREVRGDLQEQQHQPQQLQLPHQVQLQEEQGLSR